MILEILGYMILIPLGLLSALLSLGFLKGIINTLFKW